MKRIGIVIMVIVFLAACIAPAPIPTVSPISPPITPTAPTSPLPPMEIRYIMPRQYFPLTLMDYDAELATRAVSPKKGVTLACAYDDMKRMEREIRYLRVPWGWNWGTQPPVFDNFESVPNIWGRNQISSTLGGNSAWVMTFNEPNASNQANLGHVEAADLYARIEARYPDRKLTSPQVLGWGENGNDGVSWLRDWRAAYMSIYERAPRVDAIAFHCYELTANLCIAQAKEFISLARAWGVSEVWVSEFAFAPGLDRTVNDAVDEMAKFVAWMETQDIITRYSPFTNRTECMAGYPGWTFDGPFNAPMFYVDGKPSAWGRAYRKLP